MPIFKEKKTKSLKRKRTQIQKAVDKESQSSNVPFIQHAPTIVHP